MNKIVNITKIFPVFFLALIMLIESSYNSLLSFGNNTPFYDFIILFYFCFFFPETFSFLTIIILGILKSYLTGFPLSIFILSFLLIKLLVEAEKKLIKNRSFLTVLMLNGLALLLFSLLQIIIIEISSNVNLWELTKLYIRRSIITLIVYIPLYFIMDILTKRSSVENGEI